MRLTTRMSFATLTGLCLVLALAPGCSSRKKVTPEANVNPPETESTAPAPPEKEEAPPPVERTTERLALGDAFFDFDDYSLRQDAKSALETDGKYLEKNSGSRVVIEKRARAAKDYLVSYGIPTNRLTTISYGKERPFDTGHDEDSWAKNRRAHVVSK